MFKEITTQIEELTLKDFKDRFELKKTKKGTNSAVSPHEVLGVLTEEYFELNQAVHNKNDENFKEELLDIMVGAYWGLCSINAHSNLQKKDEAAWNNSQFPGVKCKDVSLDIPTFLRKRKEGSGDIPHKDEYAKRIKENFSTKHFIN